MDDVVPMRTLNLDVLRSFVAIHDTGSFRQAAASVHLSPSAVSLQIGKLEEQLSQRLLERNARRVELTEQGDVLLYQARKLLSLNDETVALFRGSTLTGGGWCWRQPTIWVSHWCRACCGGWRSVIRASASTFGLAHRRTSSEVFRRGRAMCCCLMMWANPLFLRKKSGPNRWCG